MLHYKTVILVLDGVSYPISHVDWWSDSFSSAIRYKTEGFIPRANLTAAVETPGLTDEKRRQELIDFAKTGAPPAPSHDLGDLSGVADALRQRESEFGGAAAVFEAGVQMVREREGMEADQFGGFTRCVPRMTEQKPYDARLHENILDQLAPPRGGYDPRCCHKTVLQRCKGCPYDAPKATRPASLNLFAFEVHAANQHWWHDPATGEKLDRNTGEMLMLVVSEIAECLEGERKNLMDDHLPHRKMAEVELADAVLRSADIAGATGYALHHYPIDTLAIADNKGSALLDIALAAANGQHDLVVALCDAYARKHGYDLWGAVAEKREYNRHRVDHTPEARLAANGKKF